MTPPSFRPNLTPLICLLASNLHNDSNVVLLTAKVLDTTSHVRYLAYLNGVSIPCLRCGRGISTILVITATRRQVLVDKRHIIKASTYQMSRARACGTREFLPEYYKCPTAGNSILLLCGLIFRLYNHC